MRKKKLALSTGAALMALTAALTACSGNNGNNGASPSTSSASPSASSGSTASASASATDDVDKSKDAVTLRLLINETGSKWNNYPDSAIQQEIAKKIGVKIEYVEADDNKFGVLLAGGDLPDIVRADPTKYGKQLIEGNLIIPMDDLVAQYGKDITANVPTVLDFSKQNWSQGTGNLYFLPPQIQPKPADNVIPLSIGATIRWDFYKEIGAPAMNSTDDVLNVLEQIVAKHPTTEDGKKVYGVSMWQDWDVWPYIYPFQFLTGQTGANTNTMVKGAMDTQFTNMLTDESSAYWTAMEFYNKANRKGLLDPDALTMKNNDYMAKATAGQIIMGPADWAMGDFNKQNANDGKGFMVVPVGQYAWFGEIKPLGWSDKSYSISKSSKNPEKAMEFLNYLYSYEGARTLWSGVKGVQWDMVDGKPQLKEETFALKNAGGTDWEKTGVALDINLIGLGGANVDPTDGEPLDLFTSKDALSKGLNQLQQDFSSFYGVTSPGEVFVKQVAEGKLKNFTSRFESMPEEQVIAENTVVTPDLSDDLKKVDGQLKELAMRYAGKIILAKDDAAFAKAKSEALEAFKKAGADDVTKYYTEKYAENRKANGLQ
ncbi:extracellular solute-binding protein [Cohnella fermenti]|uniref:Extracellular solute-binding protein n=1 Tax=Cohnella fermenti TaxID=2565925 RepID=A0A4S4BP51_9BACL|nr:extracellular solute-binding protein [Cohnella fermenti]THF76681.1 extracellular solute-binding protein [Cohnella fermenti]